MANDEKDGIKPSVILLGAVGLLVLFGGAMFASSYFDSGPRAPEKINAGAIEPADAPPEGGELSDRIRTFFMKGNVDDCMHRHLGKESRVEGLLEVELRPDGSATNAEARTEPHNAGVALCVQQKFARGFTFEGEIHRVSYTFNARWDSGRLVMGQNVASSKK